MRSTPENTNPVHATRQRIAGMSTSPARIVLVLVAASALGYLTISLRWLRPPSNAAPGVAAGTTGM